VDNFYSEVIPRWKIIDYNYDGYKDIICYSRYDLARGNLYYTGWIFHSDTEQFEQVEIEDISNLIIDSEQQVLSGLSWGPGDYEYAIYKIIDGKVIKTNTLTFRTCIHRLNSRICGSFSASLRQKILPCVSKARFFSLICEKISRIFDYFAL